MHPGSCQGMDLLVTLVPNTESNPLACQRNAYVIVTDSLLVASIHRRPTAYPCTSLSDLTELGA